MMGLTVDDCPVDARASLSQGCLIKIFAEAEADLAFAVAPKLLDNDSIFPLVELIGLLLLVTRLSNL